MSVWEKHRLAKDKFGFDFTEELGGGETLTGEVITVGEEVAGVWTDRTADFLLSASEAESAGVVTFTLKAADSGKQPAGVSYTVRCKVDTSLGRVLQATQELRSLDRGF